MTAPASPRLVWLDALRGLTIVLVVTGHVARGLWASGRIDAPEYFLWDTALYAFHGPLLFVLCGFSFHFSRASSRYLDDWRRRLRKVIHPYVVWTVISATLTFGMASFVNQPLGITDYLRTILGMVIWPYSIFWFLYVLALCQIAAALLCERFSFSSGQVLAIALLGLIAGYVLRATVGPVEAFQLSMFLFMFFFFCWGNWLSTRTELLTLPVLIVTAVASLLCWAAIFLTGQSIDTAFGAVAGVCITTFFVTLFRLSDNIAPRVLMRVGVYLGLMSLEIYVMHHMASGIFRIGLGRMGIEAIWLHGAGGLVAGVMVPLAMAWGFERTGLAGPLGLTRRKKPLSGPDAPVRHATLL